MELRKIGITGSFGRLGSELIRLGCSRLCCDIRIPLEVKKAISEVSPSTIVNCAAYTNVDGAESDAGYAEAIGTNAVGVGNLLTICNDRGIRLIHISTDYVFSGRKGPYSEKMSPDRPVNLYGLTKLGGEVAVRLFQKTKPNFESIIIRTTGLYGGEGYDFVDSVTHVLEKDEIFHATKQLHGNQTYIPHLASALISLVEMDQFPCPILHIASKEVISRYDFALMIANVFELNPELVIPVKSSELSWIANRPTHGGLRTRSAIKFGIKIYSILDGLKEQKSNAG